MMTGPAALDIDLEIADQIAEFYADPLGFVMFAWPWGEPGKGLEGETGPDDNQKEFLRSQTETPPGSPSLVSCSGEAVQQ
jgi:hypothetical protein